MERANWQKPAKDLVVIMFERNSRFRKAIYNILQLLEDLCCLLIAPVLFIFMLLGLYVMLAFKVFFGPTYSKITRYMEKRAG